ncbi:uncharacterized protein [Diabrotica undecimpunctata]|uniref:uncharacterized protein isoform X1 n=1 Tax=Diabrotica undecimpunctata TaxID=50387 RepID=UPI003B6421E9
MMEISLKWLRFYLCLLFLFLQLCNGNPISPNDTETDSHAKLLTGVISLLLTVCSLVFLAACLCCQRRKRFEQFRNSPVTASSISDLDHGHVNPIANGEFTIFSPLSTHYNNNVFHANETKTKAVEDSLANSYDISSWFGPDEKDFPRTRLKYIKELGSGWFGKVVEGAVQDVDNKGQSWSPVVVRILDTTSSQKEKILFLQNAAIYRTGAHANILSLVGKSLETVPYLLLQEYCPQGDLKVYLKSQKANAEQFLSTDYPLLWCHQLTSALKHLHEHDIVHPDLASRNCQLTSTLNLKLGDYGLGPFKYPSDYYQGQPAVPVRWCAPESLVCTHTTIQPKRLTPEANVWSLAVTMWEICECGEQPYWSLTDDEVISQVLGATAVRLERPTCLVLYTDYIFRLMQLCWTSAESRPKVLQLHIMLTDLLQVHRNTSSSDTLNVDEFDRRWASCKPNTIIKTDHISESILSNDERENGTKSLSLSLTNLHGSLDNLNFGDIDNSTNEQSKSINRYDIFQRTSSGSETEEENWKLKVERGAYTEKVRQKSRSVADLMVLTHVDYSESESETPLQSLEYRVNYKNVRLAGLDGGNTLENTSLTFGSEGNLLSVQDTFKDELRKLQEERRDSLPFVPDNVSQSSFRNSEVATSPSRLIQELNSSSELKPANQIFNIYNVTVDNYSPIRVNKKLSDILDVNSQLKPEWREVDKLSEINSELNQEISKLERLKEIHKVDSGLSTASSSELNQESAEAGASGNHSVNCGLQPDIGVQNVHGNFTSMEVNPDLIKELVESEKSVPDIICQSKPKSWEIDSFPRRNQPSNQSNTLDLIGVIPRQTESPTSSLGTETLASDHHVEIAEAAKLLDINFSVPEILDNTQLGCRSDIGEEIKQLKTSNVAETSKEDTADANLSLKEIQQFQQLSRWVDSPNISLDTTKDADTLKNANKTDVNGVSSNEHTQDINVDLRINSNVTDERRDDDRLDISDVETREVDCKNVIKANEGSETCDNIDENLTFDVVRGLDSVIPNESVCETFNFDVKVENSVLLNLQDDSNNNIDTSSITETERNPEKKSESEKEITENYENNLILNKKLIEDNIVTIIEEIIAQSLQEVSSKCAHEIKDVDNGVEKNESLDVSDTDQVVNFDLSLNQDEAMPNSLTHSNLFTCSTPFNKRSMEPKFSSMKFEENLSDYVPDNKDLNYSLETWDNFLGSTLDHQNQHPENMFDSFSSEPRSLLFIEGQGVDETCDIDQTRVVSKDATYCKENNKTYNCDVNEKGDTVNATYNKGEPGTLGVYSGEVWSNFFTPTSEYSNLHSDTQFDEFSSEPQSLIFIESEGVYKTCDNVDDANKKVHDEAKNRAKVSIHDTAKPSTSKDFRIEENGACVGEIDTRVGALNSTYNKEDNLLNSTYTKNENNVKEPTLEGLTDLNEGSFENGGGWFLHPQPTSDLSGEIQVQSPSTDTYVGFGIDDEIMSAIRNELLTKLPHAQGNNTDKVKEEDEWETLERNEVFLRYNVYNTPLSPIPEESLIEDVSGTTSPRNEKELDDGDWSGRTDTDTLTHEVESTSAHTLESPVRGPLNRHTPSQDSCCSNDTLFNLEDLVCGITDIERDRDSPLNVNVEEIPSEDAVKSDIDEKSVKNESSGAEDSMESNTKPQEINHFLSTERSYSAVVPLPSPEENPWKHLPASLLNYNQLSLSNTPIIKEDTKSEDSNNCDILPKTESGDDNADVLRTDSIEQDEESETNNVTFNQNHPQILDLAVTVDSNTQDEDMCCSKEKDTPTSDQETSDKENIEPLYQNSEVKDTVLPNSENEKATKLDDHLYENSNVKDSERLYQNLEPNLDPFDDYVNIVNMENSKNRLESDLLDKDHTYINTFEHIEKDDDDSIYGLLTDIRFTGPADSQMMSTSFSENNDEQGWESGSDSRSSSSGEFIWREGEHEESLKALRAAPQDVLESITPMEGIAEDNFEESDLSSTFSDDEESPEFVPSAWDKFAMPSKSALRSPEKTLKKREEQKPKGVWFKKQKYHCIYEYPKEPESPILSNPDVWKQPEFKVFTDSPTNSNMSEDFFITSSTQPFDTHNLSSQFFPGSSSWNFDNVTPDSGMEDITPGSISDANEFETSTVVPTLKQLASDVINRKKTSKISGGDVLGGLRHTRKLLKLDLPPSPSAFTSDKLFTVEPTVEPVVREKPSFTTFGKSRFMVQHVDTPDEVKGKNVSFEALPYKPNSPVVEKVNLVLDDLQHLPEDLSFGKFDFVERNLIKNEDDKCKTKVEFVRGEASLLDSGDEDSGIESTSTLERKLSNPEV